MSLKIAIQMDSLPGLDLEADTTVLIAYNACLRGYRLWHYAPERLFLDRGRVFARARSLQVSSDPSSEDRLVVNEGTEAELIDLAALDVVLMRQDPPFDLSYITATHLLDHIHPKTLVVNDPSGVRNAPEKLLVTHFPELQPPTLIARDLAAVKAFRDQYQDIILKPLYGAGGSGVIHLKKGDDNLATLLELYGHLGREPLICQAFLPEVSEGDKRILLVDGKPVGAINRVPQKGQIRSNLHVGGTARPADLTGRDLEICEIIGPTLRKMGLWFAGIDVIGGYLTEINVTSPTGTRQLKKFTGIDATALLWDKIEQLLQNRPDE